MSDRLSHEETTNLVLAGLYNFNQNIEMDGQFGREGQLALDELLAVNDEPGREEEINTVVLTLKVLGFGDDLIADGVVGDKLREATDAFIQWAEITQAAAA